MSSASKHLPPTTTRVERNTADKFNERIERETAGAIAKTASDGEQAIARRLREMDREWDIERTLEANAATVILITLALGFFVSPWWLGLTALAAAFLLQHALQGWCPPVPIFRRRGVRTSREIDLERVALRILRGDFQPATNDPQEALSRAKHGRA